MHTSYSVLGRRLARPFTALLLAASLSLPLGANAQEWSAQQKEIWKNVEAYWALDAAGDTPGFLAYFHADYRGWGYDSAIPGSKERAKKFLTHMHKASKTLVYDVQPLSVSVQGNVAFAHYVYTRLYKDSEGKEKREAGRWTDILLKDGNKWVLIGDHGGEFPPKP
jgi:ketosteroid isomerase-like protein